jgi:hypothetical protein
MLTEGSALQERAMSVEVMRTHIPKIEGGPAILRSQPRASLQRKRREFDERKLPLLSLKARRDTPFV